MSIQVLQLNNLPTYEILKLSFLCFILATAVCAEYTHQNLPNTSKCFVADSFPKATKLSAQSFCAEHYHNGDVIKPKSFAELSFLASKYQSSLKSGVWLGFNSDEGTYSSSY